MFGGLASINVMFAFPRKRWFTNAFPCFSRFRSPLPEAVNIECMIFARVSHVFGSAPIYVMFAFSSERCFTNAFHAFRVSVAHFRGVNIECVLFVRGFVDF